MGKYVSSYSRVSPYPQRWYWIKSMAKITLSMPNGQRPKNTQSCQVVLNHNHCMNYTILGIILTFGFADFLTILMFTIQYSLLSFWCFREWLSHSPSVLWDKAVWPLSWTHWHWTLQCVELFGTLQYKYNFFCCFKPLFPETVGSKKNQKREESRVAHTCNPRTRTLEAGGWWAWDQPRLHSKTVSQKKEKGWGGQRNGWAVRKECCSYRGPALDPQDAHLSRSSQPPVTPAPVTLMPSVFCRYLYNTDN